MITSAEKKRMFIERIQELATHFGLSEKKLALKCDLTQNTFTRWKDDDGPMPGAKSINKIIKGTGCNKQWLINGEGEPFQNQISEPTVRYSKARTIDNQEAYETPPSADPLGIDAMAIRNEEALEKLFAEHQKKTEEDQFKQQAFGRMSILLEWIKEEFGTDPIAIEQGFSILEEGCPDFRRWKNEKLYERTKQKNQTGTDD